MRGANGILAHNHFGIFRRLKVADTARRPHTTRLL
jgi:hypothetical protein